MTSLMDDFKAHSEVLERSKKIADIYETAYDGDFNARSIEARAFFENDDALISYDGCVRKNKTEWAGWSEIKAFCDYAEMQIRDRF